MAKKKAVLILIPTLMILLFIFIMNSALIIRPFIKNIPLRLNDLEDNILYDDWNQAAEEAAELEASLKNTEFIWMQFSIERHEIDQILLNIAEMKGSIKAKNTSDAMIAVYRVREHWNSLGEF